MPRARSARVLVGVCMALVPLAVVIAGGLAAAQQSSPAGGRSARSSAETPAETPVPEDAKAKKKEFRGRLPAYYSRVVDQEQREKIYAIQREYAPKIDALKAQLAALTAERDEKVVAELTPEQLQKIEQMKAEAKAKRAAAKTAKSRSE